MLEQADYVLRTFMHFRFVRLTALNNRTVVRVLHLLPVWVVRLALAF